MYRRHGFTLIELLVVIAIIAILAAILFPVFAQVQKTALRTRCIANEKQILGAILQYCQDNGGKVPPGYDPNASPGTSWWGNADFGATWNQRIYSYAKNKEIFLCPSVPAGLISQSLSKPYFKPGTATVNGVAAFPTTYGLNWRLCTGGGVAGGVTYQAYQASQAKTAGIFGKTITPETVSAPSKVIMICESQSHATRVLDKGSADSMTGGGGSLVYDDTGNYYWLVRWLSNPYMPQGHLGGANFGMIDGHVQFVKTPAPAYGTSGVGTAPTTSPVAAAGLRWW